MIFKSKAAELSGFFFSSFLNFKKATIPTNLLPRLPTSTNLKYSDLSRDLYLRPPTVPPEIKHHTDLQAPQAYQFQDILVFSQLTASTTSPNMAQASSMATPISGLFALVSMPYTTTTKLEAHISNLAANNPHYDDDPNELRCPSARQAYGRELEKATTQALKRHRSHKASELKAVFSASKL